MQPKQFGKYTLLKKRGRGGFGSVYYAEDNIGRKVALKILHPQFTDDEMLAGYFKREAVAMGKFKHDNIIQIYSYDTIEDQTCIAMEWVDGKDLKEKAESGEKPSAQETVRIFKQVLAALQHAHDNGVIHRDIKPSNIMVTQSGLVKIADFGIAKVAGAAKLTRTGTGAGSLEYMSPEQIAGKELDNRSDLYSVGITLYQIFTGQTPFAADSDPAIMDGHLKKQPEPLSKFVPSISKSLEAVVLKALQKRPDDRYESAAEMATALERTLAVEGASESGYEQETRTVDETVITSVSKKRSLLAYLIPALAVVAIVVALVSFRSEIRNLFSSDGKEDITPTDVRATFVDSLAGAEKLYSNEDYSGALGYLQVLALSNSADSQQRLGIQQLTAAALLMTDSADSARILLTNLHENHPQADFTAFSSDVVQLWDEVKRPQEDTTPVVSIKGSVEIVVHNWRDFERVTLFFDGISEGIYEGEKMFVEDVDKGTHLIRVETYDMGSLSDTVNVKGNRRVKQFTLTNASSKLRVGALDRTTGGNPHAQVVVDGKVLEDEVTPYGGVHMHGPHHVWVKHENYRTLTQPRIVRLPYSKSVIFELEPK